MDARRGGRADGRTGGQLLRRIALIAAITLTARPADRLSAQAGHDPANSPYKDLRRGLTVRITEGYFGGSRGSDAVPVAATNGPTTGVRLELQASGTLTVAAGVAYANTTARYFKSDRDSFPKPLGPVNNDIVLADFGVLLSLTGGKTWRGFQPYAGATMGLAFGTRIGADSSGYNFGTKFTYAPEFGVRWYPARRLSAELGGRLLVYHLSFPSSYRFRILPNILSPLSATTIHPWATFGLAWTF
jgi:opacity protein-like surface antigen